jgi:asparagine N-glycosylation enzyme membrane subunit Stt3
MTFDHAWVLIFALLPIAWAAYEWRKSSRTTALVLKALAFLAVVLALAGPRLAISESKVAVAILADTSGSITAEDLARESKFANIVDSKRGRNWSRVIPFARTTRPIAEVEH